jgi:hypothetical protein
MRHMSRRQVLALLPIALASSAVTDAQTTTIAVEKDPGCTCCEKWVAHLKENEFSATVTESSTMDAVKDAKGIPTAVRSCHTGVINGYVIEGHVPAKEIKRLLRERPAVVGLAVPGMPLGSPGMESSTGRRQAFDVLTFRKDGATAVYASYSAVAPG